MWLRKREEIRFNFTVVITNKSLIEEMDTGIVSQNIALAHIPIAGFSFRMIRKYM